MVRANCWTLGCGTGAVSLYLAGVVGGAKAHGIDANKLWVEKARIRRVDAVVLDIQCGNLQYEDGYFDAIFCGELIEHLTDTDHLIDEIFGRSLRMGVAS